MVSAGRTAGIRVLVIAGTTEGRQVVEALAARGYLLTVCVATELGRELLEDIDGPVEILAGRRDEVGFVRLFEDVRPAFAVDASHPFARAVSRNLSWAAKSARVPYIRFVRGGGPKPGEGCIYAADAPAAARILCGIPGRILLTTGANTAAVYAAGVTDFYHRGYIRVLDTPESVQACAAAGIDRDHIIAARPPFHMADNLKLIQALDISVLVTKDSGRAGGLEEKLQAAARAGICTVIIQRPKEPENVPTAESVEDVLAWLDQKEVRSWK